MSRRRTKIVVTALVAVLVCGGGAAVAMAGDGGAENGSTPQGVGTSTAAVEQRTLTSRTSVDGTLGYRGTYNLVNQAQGVITQLPQPGDLIRPGGVLYRVDGRPVALLQGASPAYRAFMSGMSKGADVEELNAALVALGYASSKNLDPQSEAFTWATKSAIEKLQHALGVTESGALALGDVVFAPTAIRVTQLGSQTLLGGTAVPGSTVLTATSDVRNVSVNLDATLQSSIKKGDQVQITLPDQQTVTGVVDSVASTAVKPASSGDPMAQTSSNPTVQVDISFLSTKDADLHGLDAAPVKVAIVSQRAAKALVVPVTALLALANGGYAVETVASDGRHTLVPVKLGIFDDSAGMVQVQSSALHVGQTVVVPAS